MSTTYLRGATNAALMMALVLGGGRIARAQNDNSNGNIVQIGHADGEDARPNMPPPIAPNQQRRKARVLDRPVRRRYSPRQRTTLAIESSGTPGTCSWPMSFPTAPPKKPA